jgi:hypothetical protein
LKNEKKYYWWGKNMDRRTTRITHVVMAEHAC